MGRLRETARKQVLLRLQVRLVDPGCDCGSGRFRQVKLHWPLGLSLHDHRSGQNLVAVRDIANTQIDEITTAQLAVDCEVEHRQVSNLLAVLEVDSDCPDILWLEWRLLPDQLAFVPGFPSVS